MHSEENTYSVLSRFLPSKVDQGSSNALLDRWAEEVTTINNYTFDNGVTGLGWLIAFLIQKEHIGGNVDEILEDVDDNIYKFTIKSILSEPTNVDQLLELVTFYQQRFTDGIANHNFYRKFSHFECMKLLTEKLNAFLSEVPVNDENLCTKINILLKYSYLAESGIIETLVEEAFYSQIEKLIIYFNDTEPTRFNEGLMISLLKFLVCVKQYQNSHWTEKITKAYLDLKMALNEKHKNASTIAIWEKVCFSIPQPRLRYEEDQSYWQSEKGKHLLFILYTNVRSFELSCN